MPPTANTTVPQHKEIPTAQPSNICRHPPLLTCLLAVAIMPASKKGVAKKNLKERAKIPSSERLDNNAAILLKLLGHKRTNDSPRDMKSIWLLLAISFEGLDLPNIDSRFTKVYQELQSLKNQAPNIKRAAYTDEFKSCLAWMAKGAGGFFDTPNKEKEELASAVEAAFAHGAPIIFGGFDFMIDLDALEGGSVTTEDTEGGSDTTEDTAMWSITTADTVLADLDDFLLHA